MASRPGVVAESLFSSAVLTALHQCSQLCLHEALDLLQPCRVGPGLPHICSCPSRAWPSAHDMLPLLFAADCVKR